MNIKNLKVFSIDGDDDVIELRSMKDQAKLNLLSQEYLREYGVELKWLFFSLNPYNADDGEDVQCKTLKEALTIRRTAIKRDPYGDKFAMAQAYAIGFANHGRPYKPGEYAY